MEDRAIRLGGEIREARAVLDEDERWLAAFNCADVATLLAIYALDVVVMPPDRPDLHGREAVADWLREFFRDHSARQVLIHDEVFADGTWAFLRGRFELDSTSRATGRTVRSAGKHLVVWRREPDLCWRAARDIWSVTRDER